MLAVNLIVGFIAFYFAFRYAFKKNMVVVYPFVKGQKYLCNLNLSFLVFSILTALLFLNYCSLLKYAVWIAILLYLSFKGRFYRKGNAVMRAYFIFVLWNLFTMTYTTYPQQGWMMLVKFSLPFLYFWLGYNAITKSDDFYVLLESVCKICCIYALILGGFGDMFLTPINNLFTLKTGLFVAYAASADLFAILISAPIIMYFKTKKKKYLLMAGWIALSPVLSSVRTGIGGIVLGLSFFYIIFKKGKAIPYIGLVLLLFIGSVFFVPEVREKMFGAEEHSSSINTSIGGQNIAMSGRDYMWEMIMEHCYDKDPTFGSGCGAALGWLKEINKDGGLVLIHSDWVQMMSESGNIGLGLYILFAFVMLFKVVQKTWFYKKSLTISFAGAMTVASFSACFFCMGFDNVITYAQQAYVIPFIILGVFYKTVDLKL